MKKWGSIVMCLTFLLCLLSSQATASSPYDGYGLIHQMDFETVVSFEENENFTYGGSGGTPITTIVSENPHSGSNSLKFTNRLSSMRRLKLHDILGQGALSESDIGRKFKISAWLYLDDMFVEGSQGQQPSQAEATYVKVGVYSAAGTPNASNPVAYKDLKNSPVRQWFPVELDYEIKSGAGIGGNSATMLGICQGGTQEAANTIFIDDIQVYEYGVDGYTGAKTAWFETSAGKSLTQIDALPGDAVTAKTTVTNYGSSTEACLLVCVKDGAGNLVHVDGNRFFVPQNTTQLELHTDFTIPLTVQQFTLEAYVWECGSLRPLAQKAIHKNRSYKTDDVWIYVNAPASGEQYGSFQVYVKGSNPAGHQYTNYNFQYVKKPYRADAGIGEHDSNLELYRIVRAYNYLRTDDNAETPSFTRLQPGTSLITNGAWEMAVQEQGAADFIGGFHGDDNMTAVSLKVDGKQISLSDGPKWIQGKQVEFIHDSRLNRYNKPNEIVGDHHMEYTITQPDGVVLHQTMTWAVDDFTVNNAYMAMLPISRCGQNIRLCDTIEFYDANGQLIEQYDTTNYGNGQAPSEEDAPPKLRPLVPITKAHAYSADGVIDIIVETEAIQGLDQLFAQLQIRSSGDNKVYFGSNYGVTVQPGDVWEVLNRYVVDLKE